MRWIWLDRFVDFQRGRSARAVKNLSLAEDHFTEHFPGYPVMPAPLMLEGLAQTGGILVGEVNDFREKVVLAKIPMARFTREVLAGEQLIYDVEILHMRPEGASVRGRVLVGEEVVAEAEIFFAHLDQARSQQLFGDHNFVFSGELKKMLGLAQLQGARNQGSGVRDQESGVNKNAGASSLTPDS
ncbi:MAG TPA: beta-hydroxyacyl-ACP dehydratase [Gemmataceae bacterium]|nr:beta-hydroxyacyl-ACP dehydratase [Gemmataceae bacterium]